jgi:hypothetical protein
VEYYRKDHDSLNGKLIRKSFKVSDKVFTEDLVCIGKEKYPYILVDIKISGCMRACNIFSFEEMLGHRIVILFTSYFPIFNPFLLTHNLLLIPINPF